MLEGGGAVGLQGSSFFDMDPPVQSSRFTKSKCSILRDPCKPTASHIVFGSTS